MAATLTGLTGTVTMSVGLTAVQTETDGTVEQAPVSHSQSQSITFGAGANQNNELYAALVTVGAGSSMELDLRAIAAALSRTGAFAKVAGIQIINFGVAADHNLEVGEAAAEAWEGLFGTAGDSIVIPPGGAFQMHCGSADTTKWAIASDTNDKLKLANPGSTSLTCKVTIWGESA